MGAFLISFCISFLANLLIIYFGKNNSSILDESEGPQKIHVGNVPRIGGFAIWVSRIVVGLYFIFKPGNFAGIMWKLILCTMPFFAIGFLEDLTKKVRAQIRFLFMLFVAVLPFYLIDARLIRSSIEFIDKAISYWPVSLILTIIAIAGFTNAINIIDGLNGLSGVMSILIMGGIAYIAFKVGDLNLTIISFGVIGAILGFLVFNYPGGMIFLGDGGAYLIGSIIAIMSLVLVAKNSTVSPWFPALLLIYPVWETVFSIYRRKIRKKKSPLQADNMHLHSLILKRIAKRTAKSDNPKIIIRQNSIASVYIWAFASMPVVWAITFWNKTLILILGVALFICSYNMLYRCLVKFRVPKWLFIKRIP